jgi:tRNA dimethylallyltransferase
LAKTIHPQNHPRIVRALEIYIALKQPPSAYFAQQIAAPPLPMIAFWCDGDNNWLQKRIAQRTQHMLAEGWLNEARALQQRYPDMVPAIKNAVGYRQIFNALSTSQIHISALTDAITRANWQYVRRQRTFLRREPQLYCIQQDKETSKSLYQQARSVIDAYSKYSAKLGFCGDLLNK